MYDAYLRSREERRQFGIFRVPRRRRRASMEKEGVWCMQEWGTGLLSFSAVLYMQAYGSFTLLSATHTIPQGKIEDSTKKRAAARDSNRERKRRQRYA